jgi:hypothetical protein
MKQELVKIDPSLLELLASHPEGGVCPFQHEIFLQDVTVAGTGYCEQIDEIFPKLTENMVLRLQRDPQNKHDQLAIGVWYEQTRIGWVPRMQNEVAARLMDAGKNICLRISGLKVESDSWQRIDSKMYLID